MDAGVVAAMAAIWLLTLAALAWGRAELARNEILKGLAWTAGTSVDALEARLETAQVEYWNPLREAVV